MEEILVETQALLSHKKIQLVGGHWSFCYNRFVVIHYFIKEIKKGANAPFFIVDPAGVEPASKQGTTEVSTCLFSY